MDAITKRLAEIKGEIAAVFSSLSNGFEKLEEINDWQLEDLAQKLRDCKRLIKDFDKEVKNMERRIDPSASPIGGTSTPSTPIFGSTPTPAFGSTGSAFGTTSSSLFGSGPSTPAFGQSSSSMDISQSSSSMDISLKSSSPLCIMDISSSSSNFSSPLSIMDISSISSHSPSSISSNSSNITQPSISQPCRERTSPYFSDSFSCSQPGNTASGGLAGISGQNNFGQNNFGQSYMAQGPAAVQQLVHATNPFGTLPPMPQMSIDRGGIQYGNSSMPVVDKSAPIKATSIETFRLSQRRIRLPARTNNPKNDNPKAFFDDAEETPTTPKGDIVFRPRENPRAHVICPQEQWPLRASAEKAVAQEKIATPVHENGKNPGASLFGGSNSADKNETLQENGAVKEAFKSCQS